MSKKLIIYLSIVGFFVLIGATVGGFYYMRAFAANVISCDVENPSFLFIREGENLDEIVAQLVAKKALRDDESFEWTAFYMEYDHKIIPGKYKLINGQSNYQFIKRLRNGEQTPVNVTFINLRTINDLAHVVCRKIDVDSTEMVTLLTNEQFLDTLGFKKQTVIGMFIPNTYQFFWSTNAKRFIARMKLEYKSFWNEKRLAKAASIGLTPMQVAVLASIVDEESNKNDEKATIAGLYINRLNRKIPLQADPTIKFALCDFARKRILTADLCINSPYNTYKILGLPPGPIRMPSVEGLEAVVGYKEHNYIFMCAKEDFSGYHNFAKSLQQHNANARRYQQALGQMGVKH